MAFFSGDVDADVARARQQGFERVCEMRDKAGYRYYYCQSSAMPDVWIEFLEVYPRLREIYASGIADAANWDGRDPIRNFETSFAEAEIGTAVRERFYRRNFEALMRIVRERPLRLLQFAVQQVLPDLER